MFYEIFFGIIAGVVFSFVAVAGLLALFYRLSGGKANYERMKRKAEAHFERVEKDMEKGRRG